MTAKTWFLLVPLFLVACATPGPEAPETPDRPEARRVELTETDPEALLARARRSDPTTAAELRLTAAMILAARNERDRVAEIISTLDPQLLDEPGRLRFTLLDAELLLDEGRPRAALAALRGLPDARHVSGTEGADLRLAGRVRGRVLAANERWLDAAREHLQLEDLLDSEAERAANRRTLWAVLNRIERPDVVAAGPALSREPALRGWLELAAINRGHHLTPEARQRAVSLWQERWQDHPAARDLPSVLARIPELLANRPTRVALLLPLSGPLATAGQAIRDGFMAAHFHALGEGASAPTVLLIDTGSGEVVHHYLEAVDQGAQLVIGPLARSAVRELATHGPRDVPILALNTTGGVDTDPDLIQFGLIPEDEGRQIAEQAWRDGMRRALALSVDDAWAARLVRTFEDRFTELGGEVVAQRHFSGTGQITDTVASSLLIGDSEARGREMRRVLASNLEFEPRRRQDVDFVMLAAEPVSARTLKPALAYHFAGDLPVYASSHIYDGSSDRRVSSDLDGIRFIDMPWRLDDHPLRGQVEQAWPEARGSAAAFFAMGIDAWQLQSVLPVIIDGSMTYPGMTGTLRLADDGRLLRELAWAVLHRGLPVPVEAIGTPVAATRR